ncbi:leucine-rich repeat protein 1-like [Pyrus x bretschneideri]|uniref:leucine-rich repeat protein 1-like n=1 Tax=Pyrus x bretschneideri TaxID=225117 RepID=UPI00202EA64F|nr:leucine-rich repeat protein 1-like [Pyrus x bretschneideri]
MEGRAQSSPFRCTNLLLLHCFLRSFVVAAAATNITKDQSALLAPKSHITYDPHSILAKNWSATASVCAWIGVTCNAPHNRVHALNLSYMGLEGTIPPYLGNLSFLAQLHLQNNSFHGSLPYQMVRLRRLKFITFAYNRLSGEIPSFFGSLPKLGYLHLGGNELSGSIPASLFNASSSSLQKLVLSDNALSGSMPSTIFNMSSLQGIDLPNCSLSDELPGNIFSQLPNLQGIYLSLNHFSVAPNSTFYICLTIPSPEAYLPAFRISPCLPGYIWATTVSKEAIHKFAGVGLQLLILSVL